MIIEISEKRSDVGRKILSIIQDNKQVKLVNKLQVKVSSSELFDTIVYLRRISGLSEYWNVGMNLYSGIPDEWLKEMIYDLMLKLEHPDKS